MPPWDPGQEQPEPLLETPKGVQTVGMGPGARQLCTDPPGTIGRPAGLARKTRAHKTHNNEP